MTDQDAFRQFMAAALLDAVRAGPTDVGATLTQRLRMSLGNGFADFIVAEQKLAEENPGTAEDAQAMVRELLSAISNYAAAISIFAIGALGKSTAARLELSELLEKNYHVKITKGLVAIRKMEKEAPVILDALREVGLAAKVPAPADVIDVDAAEVKDV